MGCAAGRQPDVAAQAQAEEPATWASKPSQVDRPAVSAAAASAKDGASDDVPGSNTKGKDLLVLDPEDDVEVISEGKAPKAEFEEEPEEPAEREEVLSVNEPSEPQAESRPVLSKQQLEEAAKMAEHRKRFDNQKYQREAEGSTAFPRADSGLPQPAQAQAQDSKAHESIMSVNASFTPRKAESHKETFECLPGGVDDFRSEAAPAPAYRNNHDLFDDDEEMLMKEILEAVDA
ncbi:unnamed protein product [Effrenium voratum]|uniref:Uncharacterized protein n=1 Tax=Effrenium voratum TaxID=2562239 RepID=A0AA36JFK9_9DINO|nr:unnamed protein product [Effrenium voratum]CAJ1405318.1 unnamed protein product [Effrenium voratum]